jgi:hypothetical protein
MVSLADQNGSTFAYFTHRVSDADTVFYGTERNGATDEWYKVVWRGCIGGPIAPPSISRRLI